MKTSVIIPTKNEEAWIENILSILSVSNYINEIIIVDNDCGVNISRIASKFSCQLLKDTTPAKSRNSGAKFSSGELLIFIDADIIVPSYIIHHLTTYLEEKENVGVVHFKIKPMTDNFFINFSYHIMNFYFKFLNYLGNSQGLGNFIAVRRKVFNSIDGFDEGIKVAEDADFFRRASKITTISYISKPMIYASTRRFKIENHFLYSIKCIMWAVLRILGSKKSIIDYKWEKYDNHIARADEDWIKYNLPDIYNNMIQPAQQTSG